MYGRTGRLVETDFAPLGETRLRAIVDAILLQGDGAEGSALEAKSDIDPNVKGVGVAKIAKFILGMANRMPNVAKSHFKGYGIMVIGAEQGRSPGVPRGVEAHELSDRLKPYLGPDGPGWDLARLTLSETHEVLFVLVDPPTSSQPLYVCHKDFQPDDRADSKFALADGDIYVRDKSRTRKAKAAEVQALLARGVTTEPDVAVDIGVEGRALLVLDTDTAIRQVLDGEASRRRSEDEERKWEAEEPAKKKVEEARPHTTKSTMASGFNGVVDWSAIAAGVTPRTNYQLPSSLFGGARQRAPEDPRDVEEGIREHEERCWTRWPECRDNLYSATAERIRFTIENQAASYLPNPQIIVSIHRARAVDPKDADYFRKHEVLPFLYKPVRASGPYGFPPPEMEYRAIRPVSRNPRVSWTNEGGGVVRVVLTPAALRPSTPWISDDDGMILVALDPDAIELSASWSLTAEGVGKRFDGAFSIPLQRVEDIRELLRAYLLAATD